MTDTHSLSSRRSAARRLSGGGMLALALLAGACTSRDEKAATAAAIASDAFQQGQLAVARYQIGRAIAARDDVSDYWLLSARIALEERNYTRAFDAYESVLMLDRTNVEALTRLCQIALSTGQPSRAERYANQLLVLQPGNNAAVTLQAALALGQGDKRTAARLLDQVLAAQPGDAAALIVKSNLLAANEDYVGAARAGEAALATPGDPNGRLAALRDVYRKGGDAAGYRRTIARLASANPRSANAQLDYARSRYDAGDAAGGLAAARRVLALRPDDVATAGTVLALWLGQGAQAMPAGTVVANARGGSLETRAAFASYANAMGRPDQALAVLGDAAAGAPATAATANAKAARAQARAMRGATAAAAAEVAAVLAADADQPRALATRAWLRARAGDRRGAIEDYRHALAGDAGDATARLALAELQRREANGDVLAIATLQDGVDDENADPRLAARLAALLREQGRNAAAAEVIATEARRNPFRVGPRG